MKPPKDWPVEIKNGSATVKIYRVARTKAGAEYVEFRVGYYDTEGKRRFESFSDYGDADSRARKVVASITKGDAKALSLTADDTLVYLRATDLLKGSSLPLDAVVSDYVAAKKFLPNHSLTEAARFYAKSCADLKPATVAVVVSELLAAKEKRVRGSKPASADYLKDLRNRLEKFAGAFQCQIADVRAPQIEAFVDALKTGERTRFNWLRLIKTLFNYAQAKKYFPKEVDPLEAIITDYDDDGEIEIFTPEEMRRLLAAACPEMVPFLALGAFAGVRNAEIGRLDWAQVKDKYIEITKKKGKVRSRRLVPIQPNLSAWLANHRQESGPVMPYASVSKQIVWVCEDTGENPVQWKHNAPRHSFISYRLALLQNENVVASEAGNSPAKIYSSYRELVTPEQAAEWFAIMPAVEASNIVQMKGAA